MDDDAVNLITEEAHPATETNASIAAASIEVAAQSEGTHDEQGKDEGATASQMQNMQNMMNMNPMFNGMDMSQMMQMMASGGMNMNGFNPMMGKFSYAIYALRNILISLSNARHGDESNVTKHVRCFRRPWCWHEWDERHEYGHEFPPQSGNVWSRLE